MKTATVTTQADGQIVHLPAGVHLEGDEVLVKQVGAICLVDAQASRSVAAAPR